MKLLLNVFNRKLGYIKNSIKRNKSSAYKEKKIHSLIKHISSIQNKRSSL